MRWRHLKTCFDIATGVAIIVLAGTVVKSTWWPNTAAPSERVVTIPPTEIQLSHRALAQSGARVALIEFADFECAFCRRFARDVLPELRTRQAELGVAIDFRHRPLDSHRNAVRIAVAAECAHDQNRFWPMHDALFAGNGFDEFNASRYFTAAGADTTKMATCMAAASESVLAADHALAKRFEITATPTFLMGTVTNRGTVSITRKLVGVQTLEDIRAAIRELLS